MPIPLIHKIHRSDTGSFQELARESEGFVLKQLSLLTVSPGCTRGGHYHTRKKEWFCPISGRGTIRLVDIDSLREVIIKIDSFYNKEFYYIPPNIAHWVSNPHQLSDLVILILISEEYDEEDPDTFRFEEM